MQPKTATHYYIRVQLPSQAEFSQLIEWSDQEDIELWDYPLDYEILTDGQQYREEGLADEEITPHYAVVPVEKNLPSTVAYELLDELYLDDSNPFIFIETYKATGNDGFIGDEIIGDGIPLPEIDGPIPPSYNPPIDCPEGCVAVLVQIPSPEPYAEFTWECDCSGDDGGGGETNLNECGCPIPRDTRWAAGCVQVINDAEDPKDVWNVKVQVKNNWFSYGSAYTDSRGCWLVSKRHRGNVRIRYKFANPHVTVKNTAYALAVSSVRNNVLATGPTYNNLYRLFLDDLDNTSIRRRLWAAAHTVTTVEEYFSRAATDGIPITNKRLNWITIPDNGAGSAPMLKWIPYAAWPDFILAAGIVANPLALPLPALRALSVPFRPDVTNPYEQGESAEEYNATAFHELGHTSHYSNVGETYWFQYRNHIVNNGGYGELDSFAIGSNPGHVALGEALGSYIGARFGGDADGGEDNRLINNFIPTGLCWDLMDDTPDEELFNQNGDLIGLDRARHFTPAMFFNEAQNGVNSIQDFGDRLRDNQLQNTPTNQADFDQLINFWDVL